MHDCHADADSETGQPGGKTVPAQPPRAADAFYAKLFPALEVSSCSACMLLVLTRCLTCPCVT